MPNRPDKKIRGFVSVFAAILGNLTVTVIKFIGFFISGSSTMFSEGVHSFADTMNQTLLMIGIKRSRKRADAEFSYGYGQERFLWALISACGIFFLGAGVTTYHGINYLLENRAAEMNYLIFLILAASFAIEAVTFLIALRELKRSDRGATWRELLRDGDPTTIAVVFEDGVALLGVLIALSSVTLTRLTGQHYWDGIGSIVIGLALGVMAIVLINKNRSYLIKRSIPEEYKEKIIEVLRSDPAIEKILDFKSSIIDVGHYRVKCEVEFNGSALLSEEYLGGSLEEDYKMVGGDFEEFKKFLVGYLDRVPRVMGKKIDEIERKVKEAVPQAAHIDIEIN